MRRVVEDFILQRLMQDDAVSKKFEEQVRTNQCTLARALHELKLKSALYGLANHYFKPHGKPVDQSVVSKLDGLIGDLTKGLSQESEKEIWNAVFVSHKWRHDGCEAGAKGEGMQKRGDPSESGKPNPSGTANLTIEEERANIHASIHELLGVKPNLTGLLAGAEAVSDADAAASPLYSGDIHVTVGMLKSESVAGTLCNAPDSPVLKQERKSKRQEGGRANTIANDGQHNLNKNVSEPGSPDESLNLLKKGRSRRLSDQEIDDMIGLLGDPRSKDNAATLDGAHMSAASTHMLEGNHSASAPRKTASTRPNPATSSKAPISYVKAPLLAGEYSFGTSAGSNSKPNYSSKPQYAKNVPSYSSKSNYRTLQDERVQKKKLVEHVKKSGTPVDAQDDFDPAILELVSKCRNRRIGEFMSLKRVQKGEFMAPDASSSPPDKPDSRASDTDIVPNTNVAMNARSSPIDDPISSPFPNARDLLRDIPTIPEENSSNLRSCSPSPDVVEEPTVGTVRKVSEDPIEFKQIEVNISNDVNIADSVLQDYEDFEDKEMLAVIQSLRNSTNGSLQNSAHNSAKNSEKSSPKDELSGTMQQVTMEQQQQPYGYKPGLG